MFPPVEEAVFRNNPRFAALYTTLTTALLNPDGSTRKDVARKMHSLEQEVIRGNFSFKRKTAFFTIYLQREASRNIQTRTAKQHLLAQAILTALPPLQDGSKRYGVAARQVSQSASITTKKGPEIVEDLAMQPTYEDFPAELMDILLLLPPLLQAGGIQCGRDMLEPPPYISGSEINLILSSRPFTAFSTHLPRLARIVAESLNAAACSLVCVLYASVDPSYLHRHVKQLEYDVATLKKNVEEAKQMITVTRRLSIVTATLRLLDQNTGVHLATLLRILETKHGTVRRFIELRAAEVSLAAQKIARLKGPQSLFVTQQTLYGDDFSPDIALALRHYTDHLRDSTIRLEEAVRERKTFLNEYGVFAHHGKGPDGKPSSDGGQVPGGKEDAMREMARVYLDMKKQMADVSKDLGRLAQR